MRINTKVRYAIRMMADIAKHANGRLVSLKDVAHRQQLSKVYLSQLSAPLKRASLLKSTWGNKGGFALARPPFQITLLDIMEAVEGPIAVLDCVLDSGSCERADYCECVGIWREVNEAIVKTLEQYSLADLIEKTRQVSRKDDLCRIEPPPGERRHDKIREQRNIRSHRKRQENLAPNG
jgi:Rrf2 family cysteine metabolism transcriptional repressor